ncbi:MAG: OmpA family protein [Thermodesulfobacteriales bacterium]|jgi:outer membrane protein OmpA-like peptidoglycan-associated protein|nr:MAG: OmpA family protein [Thermodesulfobacteriales bacterium]
MLDKFKKAFLLIVLVIGTTGGLTGCASLGGSNPPPTPPGKIGQMSKFDINQASEQEIYTALYRDGSVAISGGILFAFDSAKINPGAEAIVAKIAGMMGQHPTLELAVVGYTDNTGDFNYNLGLSKRRADAIVNQLVKEGVSRDRLAGVGVGPLNPIASNATPQGQAENRRVELVLIELESN